MIGAYVNDRPDGEFIETTREGARYRRFFVQGV
jgi:hypothetical protein